MRRTYSAVAVAVGLLASVQAFGGECGGDGPPCPPPPPAPMRALPPGVVSYGNGAALVPSGDPANSGQSFVFGENSGGYIVSSASATASTGTVGGGLYGSALVTGETSASANGHSLAEISASHGVNQTPIGALANIFVLYKVTLHARDASAASALFAPLTTSGAIASVTGLASLGATGDGFASGIVTTGAGIFENSSPFAGTALYGALGSDYRLLGRTQFTCSPAGRDPDSSGCGINSFTLPVNFVSATNYAGGDALDFIGNIELRAFASGSNGTAMAYVDPQVTLFPGLDPHLYSLTLGSTTSVPEPATWLLMVIGFGSIGRMMRRRPSTIVAA